MLELVVRRRICVIHSSILFVRQFQLLPNSRFAIPGLCVISSGVVSCVDVSVVDAYGNAVPDGAVVKLSSSAGQLSTSTVTTSGGSAQFVLTVPRSYADPVTVDAQLQGESLAGKIEVTGALLPSPTDDEYQGGNLLVVWIESQTHQISRLWLRYYQRDKNFGYIALNIGNYENVAGGFLLPTYISYSHSDRHQQFSEQQMMTVEFQKLQTVMREKDRKWFYE